MIYLLAVVGVIAIGFLSWRAFGPQVVHSDQALKRTVRRRGPVGPDDDPDFLRDLDNRTRGTNSPDGEDS